MDNMAPVKVEQLKITVTMDNFYDALLMPEKNVQRYRFLRPENGGISGRPPQLSAEHGFSCYIEVLAAGQKSTLLMDFGASDEGTARNMKAMEIDLTDVDAALLSHGHFDHFGGLEKVFGGNWFGGERPLPFYVGREAFSRRFTNLPGAKINLGSLEPGMVEAAGCKIKEINQPTEILPGILVLGPIPRKTEFEKGSPILMVERNGVIEQDDFVGELSLAFNVAGKGLVILTACAHAGIVNIVRQAVELTGVQRIHSILGGFHLSGAPPEKIQMTVSELGRLGLDQIVPMHCTGFQALKAISDAMPEAFTLYSTGSQYVF